MSNEATNPNIPIIHDEHNLIVLDPAQQAPLTDIAQSMELEPPTTPNEARTKRHFTYEEDQQIRQLVEQHGTGQWTLIASQLQNRSARQVRDRWRCYLDPNVQKKEWTLEEDQLLLQLYQSVGRLWSQLVKFFPGRTDVDLKNHWNKLQRHAKKIQPNQLDVAELSLKVPDQNITVNDMSQVMGQENEAKPEPENQQ
ncbi:RNA polymerase II transcription regulator recruiting protein [Trichomonas vaginalis G3]|uniref:RNA polymerase II transcription regulator recruiting protein n=1 Tax=Trichomonas vaginalis (strain ATCC PRA-98 / G3) TaxID=412133 RepID=UPI0021E597BF|nr:RNA polymerase II transcription regulator recruiting protein [Trichomonas vaginalis G3]KAI5494655.1 RNA polymerase II transcription regulator recruiting protein [Trichomonas vaginalis G3]